MNTLKDIIKSKGDDTFERAVRRYGVVPKEAEKLYDEIINSTASDTNNSSNSSVYFKVLDVDTNIEDDPDTTLTVDSQKVLDFFSDAFSLGDIDYFNKFPKYSIGTMQSQLAKISIEEKRKELGLPNNYDTLQKNVPLLAIRTRTSYYNGEMVYPEKLLILNLVCDYREKAQNLANGGTIYCIAKSADSDLWYEDIQHPQCAVTFSNEGLRIIVIE